MSTEPHPFAKTIPRLTAKIQNLLSTHPPNRRLIIALAGIPGSGKTTLSTLLTTSLNATTPSLAVALPMDGFHYPRSHLDTFEDPAEAHRRRGAPWTFDGEAWVELVEALAAYPATGNISVVPRGLEDVGVREGPPAVYAPSFSHSLKDPVAGGIVVSGERVVVCEGNYLLMDTEPWSRALGLYAERWLVECDRGTAMRRLVGRHLATGIAGTEEEARERVEKNDLVNGLDMLEKVGEMDERFWSE